MKSARAVRAEEKDLEKILEIQRAAFREEAEETNNFNISPLAETLDMIREDFRRQLILKAEDGNGVLRGSIRGRSAGGTTYVSKLSVSPDARRKGLAALLLKSLEEALPGPRFQLFTRRGNPKSINLYLKCGYSVFKEESLEEGLDFVFMEKLPNPGS